MDGLQTAEESSSETSDDDGEEAPSTSGMSPQALDGGRDDMELAAGSSHHCPGASVPSAASRSPEPPPTPGTGSGHTVSAGRCARLEQSSAESRVDETMAVETEKSQEERGTEGEEPKEDEATGPGATRELKQLEMAGRDRAVEAAPGEGRESAPLASLEGSQSGSTVSSLGVHVQSQAA